MRGLRYGTTYICLELDLESPELLDLDCEGLDVPLQGCDLSLSGIAPKEKKTRFSNKSQNATGFPIKDRLNI